MTTTTNNVNIQIGIWSAFVSSIRLILADFLLNYFSAPWLLLTSAMAFPLFIPKAWKSWRMHRQWTKKTWKALALIAFLSGSYNLTFLLSADLLPIAVASMFLSIVPIVVLPLACHISKKIPTSLEILSIILVLAGVALILQIHTGRYSLTGLLIGFLTTFIIAVATIFAGKSRNIVLASEVVISRQTGNIIFGLAGLSLYSKSDLHTTNHGFYLWSCLGLYGLVKIFDSFISSRAQFRLPPLLYQNLSLLSLPIVCIIEALIAKQFLTPLQWIGVLAIICSGVLASLSKQKPLEPI